tara:strand:- start:2108 stop:2557 length:450 start_codon:yes stop_codon:yes gene_type:complete
MKKKLKRKRSSSKKKHLGKFKSSIEKYCSDRLRESGIPFLYEEKEFLLMDKFRFENKYFKMTAKRKDMSDRSNSIQQPIRYTPDFVCKNHSWIIETKGYLPSHHDFPMRWKIFLKHIMDNNLNYDVYLAKNRQQVDQAISEIKKSMSNE